MTVMAMLWALAAPAVGTPGVAPVINGISESNMTIDPGGSRYYKVAATGVDSGAVATFSGDGLTATIASIRGDAVRLQITADSTAAGGFRDLTITNPDSLSDTFEEAIEVTGNNPPPMVGNVDGFAFSDANGNGVLDPGETGLESVPVTVVDSLGTSHDTATDSTGAFLASAVATGSASVTFTTPGGHSLTSGNDVQNVTVSEGTTVSTAHVGYLADPSGSMSGHVFNDTDGNGTEDGAETGLSGVTVNITDANATNVETVTDANGDFAITDLAIGDAAVVFTPPTNYTLTTGNDVQTVTISDGTNSSTSTVGYQPPAGTPPDITGISGSTNIDPGQTRFLKVNVTGHLAGATWVFSGTGVTATLVRSGATQVRLSVTATVDAEGGPRSLTVTNPDGLSDTLPDALTVTGDAPPPDTGTVSGHVYNDVDGNGSEDAGDSGLSGVTVSFTAADGSISTTATDAAGDYVLNAGPGQGNLVVSPPTGYSVTSGNGTQILGVTVDMDTSAAPVGLQAGSAAFVNVAGASGISLSHTMASCGGPPIGVGAAWADVDGDGDQDLYTTDQAGVNHLYLNNGDTNGDDAPDFTDVAGSMGVSMSGVNSFATVFADIDNDGDQDLFVASDSGNRMFRNDLTETGSLGFVDISATSGLSDNGRVETATFGDIDNDGFLDLYIAKHMTCGGTGDNIDHLFHNNGDGTFSDWNEYLCGGGASTCADVEGLGFMAAIFDFDRDGYQDIYLVNDNISGSWQPNKMFKGGGPDGSGGWIFTEVGASTNTDHSVNGMGLGLGDYDNDGWIDIAFSDAAPGHLLRNTGTGSYSDVSVSSGVNAETAGKVGWGTAFIDFNNDGWQDLFFANGSIGSVAPLANSLLVNNADGSFTDVSDVTGMNDESRGRSVTIVDMDGDGWTDVFIGNYDAPPLLMHNRSGLNGNVNDSLTITVEGTESNRDGIGTELLLTTPEGTQRQVITSGSNHGGGSQKAAFFGLGSHVGGDLTVTWPNGVVQDLGSVGAGSLHLVEPTS